MCGEIMFPPDGDIVQQVDQIIEDKSFITDSGMVLVELVSIQQGYPFDHSIFIEGKHHRVLTVKGNAPVTAVAAPPGLPGIIMIVLVRIVKNKIRGHLLGEILQIIPPVKTLPVGRMSQALDLCPESPVLAQMHVLHKKIIKYFFDIPLDLYLPANTVRQYRLGHRRIVISFSVPDHTEQTFDITSGSEAVQRKDDISLMNIIDQQVASVHKKIGGHIIMIGETVILRPQGKYDGPMGVIGLYRPGIAEENKLPFVVHHELGQVFGTFHHQVMGGSAHQVKVLIEKYAVDDILFIVVAVFVECEDPFFVLAIDHRIDLALIMDIHYVRMIQFPGSADQLSIHADLCRHAIDRMHLLVLIEHIEKILVHQEMNARELFGQEEQDLFPQLHGGIIDADRAFQDRGGGPGYGARVGIREARSLICPAS